MPTHDPTPLSQDVAFDLLSNVRRRFVLRRLQERPDGIELSELAEELAAEENEVPPDELTAQQRKRTYVSLYQTHVPKLAEVGVVEYDPDTGVVSPTPHVDELGQYFQQEEPGLRWQYIYGGIAGAGLLLYLLVQYLRIPLIDTGIVGVVVLVAVAVVSAAHYLYSERLAPKPEIPIDK